MKTGWRKRILLILAIIAIVQVPNAYALYEMLSERSKAPRHSSQQPFFHDCLSEFGTTREKAWHAEAAFCNCYTEEVLHQQFSEGDQDILLRAIAGERPWKFPVAGHPPRRTAKPLQTPHLRGFLDATLASCRPYAEKFAEAERRMMAQD